MGTLLLLALTLSLDSLRASIGLGATKIKPARQFKLALAFGICDGLAPLVGLLAGQWLVGYIDVLGESVGPLLLGGYGVYLIYVTFRYAGSADEDESRWIVWGIPLSLSLDNMVAGASLGMIKFPVALSVITIGVTSGLMSLLGFRLANITVNRMKLKTELLGGIFLVLIALSLALDNR
jgi:putative Mn2+ efflux pump MntP